MTLAQWITKEMVLSGMSRDEIVKKFITAVNHPVLKEYPFEQRIPYTQGILRRKHEKVEEPERTTSIVAGSHPVYREKVIF